MSALRDHLATPAALSNRSKVRALKLIISQSDKYVSIFSYSLYFFSLEVFILDLSSHSFIHVNHLSCVLCCVCTAILNELLQRENRVLHFWTMKKRHLDQCQQYVVFECSAKQVKTLNCTSHHCLCVCVCVFADSSNCTFFSLCIYLHLHE